MAGYPGAGTGPGGRRQTTTVSVKMASADGIERAARRLLEVETVTGPELRELLADGQAPIPT